jgi:hypothetical protein
MASISTGDDKEWLKIQFRIHPAFWQGESGRFEWLQAVNTVVRSIERPYAVGSSFLMRTNIVALTL